MAATALERRSAGTMRRDILVTAGHLFYGEGIHAVSADRIIRAAEISKVTFYRHFASKDELVVAYLGAMSSSEQALTAAARERFAGDPHGLVGWFARLVAAQSCRPGFRGCAFINAASEYPDAASAVRRAVETHRAWFRSVLVELAEQVGVDDAERVADQLVVLRDGLLVSGYLGTSPETLGDSFRDAVEAVLAGSARTAATARR